VGIYLSEKKGFALWIVICLSNCRRFKYSCSVLFWTVDWWRPPTFTYTRVGLEDFLLGFTNGGLAVSIYGFVSGRKLLKTSEKHNSVGLLLLILFGVLMSVLFWGFHITSFWSTIISLLLLGLVLIILKHSLFFSSLANSILMVILVVPFYLTVNILFPDAVANIYQFKTLSNTLIMGIPIEELVFYALFGFVTPAYFRYWKGLEYE
jgi:hypothetical protein